MPILRFAESVIAKVSAVGKGTPASWWLAILTLGPLLGSLITGPAAMTICALLLRHRFYSLKPSEPLKYATLGLLFVNISVGGVLTQFASPVGDAPAEVLKPAADFPLLLEVTMASAPWVFAICSPNSATPPVPCISTVCPEERLSGVPKGSRRALVQVCPDQSSRLVSFEIFEQSKIDH